jgi:hypothetical protein
MVEKADLYQHGFLMLKTRHESNDGIFFSILAILHSNRFSSDIGILEDPP